ncbi:MAG: septum formation inhibitor Maf [Desulfobacterales bacterium]|nr:septum formation inhibitor Maf [Desulfobacterales bacterium]
MQQLKIDSQIILASKSPRRQFLLKNAGIEFTVYPSRIREADFAVTRPQAYVKTLAEAKADDVAALYPDSWVIGADSIVWADGQILEKPRSVDAARAMMEQLSSRTHYVFTGYACVCRAKAHQFSDVSETAVTFKELTSAEIEWYIATDEPYDKAGGYAIQGLGSFMIQRIDGSYTNVVGLPLCEVMDHLIRQGVIVPDAQNKNYR